MERISVMECPNCRVHVRVCLCTHQELRESLLDQIIRAEKAETMFQEAKDELLSCKDVMLESQKAMRLAMAAQEIKDRENAKPREALSYWIKRAEKAEVEDMAGLYAYAEKLEKLIKEQDAEIAQLLGALLCEECKGEGVIRYVEDGWRHMIKDCPVCGPIRKALKEGASHD